MDKISVVVPCKNEEVCVELFYEAFIKTITELPVDYELIFVDDGSTDRTLDLFRKLALKDSNVRYISLSRNFGKEGAMYAGLKSATGDFVSIMDVDLQDPPELLKEMYAYIKEDKIDCVACRRVNRKGEPPIRSMFANLFYKIINKMSKVEIVSGARDFRLMSRRMTDAILSMSEVERFSKGLFGWVGFTIKWLEYKNIDRAAGKTKWSFYKLFKYAVGGIEDFSTVPLRINFVFSVLAFLAAVGFIIADIVMYNSQGYIDTFFALTPVILLATSMLLFGIGCACEYISKIFFETKRRPLFIVKETEADILNKRDN